MRAKRFGWGIWVVVGVVAAVGAFLLARDQATGGGDAVDPPARGLPNTPDYHALYIYPNDSSHLLLGTHVGVYESTDGGVSWQFLALEGQDAMHFASLDGETIWAAGHNVLERSSDGGKTWSRAPSEGLPSRDIHGFALDHETRTIYAAVAGEGLYRSDDDGATFEEVATDVGPGVYALTTTHDGVVFAADGQNGVLVNPGGEGIDWEDSLAMETRGLAANESASPDQRVLAAGEAVQLFTDSSGWTEVLRIEEGAGPVAYAPEDPSIAYVVGFDRKLYRSSNGGDTWQAVE